MPSWPNDEASSRHAREHARRTIESVFGKVRAANGSLRSAMREVEEWREAARQGVEALENVQQQVDATVTKTKAKIADLKRKAISCCFCGCDNESLDALREHSATCAEHPAVKALRKHELIAFSSRGIGLDTDLSCFVCQTNTALYMPNIAAFVSSKEDGERVVQMFDDCFGGARLDYREREPNWVQVKVGACEYHKDCLQLLHDVTRSYGCRINANTILGCATKTVEPAKSFVEAQNFLASVIDDLNKYKRAAEAMLVDDFAHDEVSIFSKSTIQLLEVAGTHFRQMKKDAKVHKRKMSSVENALGSWMSAALDDASVCDEMKTAIRAWFDAFDHTQPEVDTASH